MGQKIPRKNQYKTKKKYSFLIDIRIGQFDSITCIIDNSLSILLLYDCFKYNFTVNIFLEYDAL